MSAYWFVMRMHAILLFVWVGERKFHCKAVSVPYSIDSEPQFGRSESPSHLKNMRLRRCVFAKSKTILDKTDVSRKVPDYLIQMCYFAQLCWTLSTVIYLTEAKSKFCELALLSKRRVYYM
jgi:hypothetical protein